MLGRPSPVSSGVTAHRFDLLDAIRGLAALLVVQRHTASLFGSSKLASSHLAVDVFFIMSGVVVAHAYKNRLTGGMGVLGFMKARLLRLYPLYFLGTALVVAALLAFPPENRADSPAIVLAFGVLLNLFFLPIPPFMSLNTIGVYVDNPGWSLFDELVVNAVFAAVVSRLTTVFLLVILGASGLTLFLIARAYGGLDVGFTWDAFAAGLPRAFYGFFAGVLIERMYHRLPEFGVGTGAACLAGILVVMVAGLPGGRWIYDLVAAGFVLPLLVLVATRVRLPDKINTICAVLGAISYPAYTLHVGLAVAVHGFASLLTGPSPAAAIPWLGNVYIVLLVGLSLTAHYYFDAPVRRWLGQRLPGENSRSPAPAPQPL